MIIFEVMTMGKGIEMELLNEYVLLFLSIDTILMMLFMNTIFDLMFLFPKKKTIIKLEYNHENLTLKPMIKIYS